MTNTVTSAGLLHLIGWDLPCDYVELSPHIKLCRAQDSQVWRTYERLCNERDVDDGEPFMYESYVLLEPDGVSDTISSGDPYFLLDRICNIIALVLSHPIPMCRVIQSEDSFKTCLRTFEIYQYGMQTDFLMKDPSPQIDGQNAGEIKLAWLSATTIWGKSKISSRVSNALTYFYYAWRSMYLDQSCLNLAVCLELLFTPHSQGEASHQISFNVARFLGKSPTEMKTIYRTIRTFYGVRSRIVHGGMPEDSKVTDATVEAFKLCSDCLRKILLNGFASIFDNEARRKELLISFMFP